MYRIVSPEWPVNRVIASAMDTKREADARLAEIRLIFPGDHCPYYVERY
jgi:hypothetical protein